MTPPLVTEAQLQTLPDGLYQVGDKGKKGLRARRQTGTYFDMALNEMVTGPMVLMARVKPEVPTPMGIDSMVVRRDGKQIITQWVGDPAQKKEVDLQKAGERA